MVTWSNISVHLYCKNVYNSVHSHHIALLHTHLYCRTGFLNCTSAQLTLTLCFDQFYCCTLILESCLCTTVHPIVPAWPLLLYLETGSLSAEPFFPFNETSPMCRKWSKLNVVSQEQLVILTNHSMISGQVSTNQRDWIVWHNHTTTQPHNHTTTHTQSKCRSPSAFCCRTWK